MPVCAVTGCGNGTYAINKWKAIDCEIHLGYKHGVGQCVCPPPFMLHTFPTEARDPSSRSKWTRLINRKDGKTGKNWTPRHFSRVCSKHFPEDKPTPTFPNPILQMGYQLGSPKKLRQAPKTRISPKKATAIIPPAAVEPEIPEQLSEITLHNDHDYSISIEYDQPNCQEENLCKKVKQLEYENLILKQNIQKLSHKAPLTSNLTKFIANDNSVRLNTGLPTKYALDSLFQHLAVKAQKMRYWSGHKKVMSTKVRKFTKSPKKFGPQRKLLAKEELILVLMKLRLGLTNEFLGSIAGISEGTCSQILNTWIRFLAQELRPLIFWPDRLTITKMLPHELSVKYPSLRCTLDCTEIYIERPRHMELQKDTWSDYKKSNTAKYLVGIAPNGMVSFLSDGFGGRSSDKQIVNESRFLDLVDPGDVILADRGFTINAELLMRYAKLEIPPPSSGYDQQTTHNVAKTKKIANARIHVERAIGRMKWFAILRNTVPISLIPILDDVMIVCAALCNLLPPLVGQ